MCSSLAWVQQLLVWIVILVAVVALFRLLVPWVLGKLGVDGGIVLAALNIVVWALIIIAVIYFIFALIGCLLSAGHLPLFPR